MKYKKINVSEITSNSNNIILPEGTIFLNPSNELRISDGVTINGLPFPTDDITFNGSTISTRNTDQNMTITTNGSGDILIGADRNMIFDMNAWSAKGILIQDSQEDGYDNTEIPSTLKVGSIYHETGSMVIESDGRILDASGIMVNENGDPSENPVYGGIWITNGQDTGLRIPAQTGTVGGMASPNVEIHNNEKVWKFSQDGAIDAGNNGIDIKSSQYAELWCESGPSGTQNNWLENPTMNQTCYIWSSSTGAGIQNYRGEDGVNPGWNHGWSFNTDGNTQIPGNLLLNNGTSLAKGTFDNGTSGGNGISLNCAVGYELNWQGGRLKSTSDGGLTAAPIYVDSPMIFNPLTLEFGTSNGTITVDTKVADIFDIPINGNTTLDNPINPVNGKTIRYRIVHEANNLVVSLGDKFKLPLSATSPLPWSSTSGSMDILAVTYHSGRDKWDIVSFVPGY